MLLHSRHLSRALLALLPLALCTDALFSKKGGVVLVNDKNFKQEVLNTEHAVIAKFYAPWCGHCKQFAPEFSLAAKNLTGLVKQVAIDCDEKDSAALCQRYEIKGFPTVKLFPGASSTADKNGKFANYKIPTDYRGGRTAKDLVKFALAQIPSFVKSISSNPDGKKTVSIEDFLATKSTKGNDLPKAILFTNKAITAPLFKALSVDFHDTVLLGEVRESEKDIVSQFGVKKFPTLLVFPEEGKEPVTYEGAIKHTDLFSFLAKYGVPVTLPKAGGEKGKASPKTEKAPEPFDPSIAQISTQENFESLCLKSSGTCILAFLIVEPDYPESVAAHEETLGLLSKLKTKLHNASLSSPFKFFWMDAISETKLPNDFRVADDRPALLALNNQRKLYRLFTGAFDEEGITQWLKETSAGKGRNFRYEFEPMMTEQKKKKTPTESKKKEEKKEKEKEKEVEKERKEEKEEKEEKKKEEEKEKVRDEL